MRAAGGDPHVSVMMLWHLFELVLRPRGNGVNVTFVVAHEVQLAYGDGNRLCTYPEKATDINDCGACGAGAVDVLPGCCLCRRYSEG